MARRFSLHAQPLLRATDASIAKMSNVTKSHHLQLATAVGARYLLALFQISVMVRRFSRYVFSQ
jgi:hypothetical protein